MNVIFTSITKDIKKSSSDLTKANLIKQNN